MSIIIQFFMKRNTMEVISDKRTIDQFRTTTFSKYQRSAVKKELLQSLIQSKIEPSMYWLIELLCSGHVTDIWETILFFYAKHIHVSNPKLPFYIESRFTIFKQCIETSDELSIRNNEIVRKLFAEIIIILCVSNKHHSYEIIKFNTSDFNLLTTDRLKAPSVTFIENIFKRDDPKPLFVPLNELSYQLFSKHTIDACYWIEWILEYTSKKKCVAQERTLCAKHSADSIWIVWEVFLHHSSKLHETIQKIMKSVLSLFCIRYTPACNERRRFLLYYAISLCCESISLTIPIIEQKHVIEPIYEKCKIMYKNIKKNEVL
jgi:hypothetical protein